jgi:hypothetical protein
VIKFLFFDLQEVERARGLTRRAHRARKHASNPLLTADPPGEGDAPWEHGNLQLYGSVIRRPDGRFQLWYQTVRRDVGRLLGYAESDDGFAWRRPRLDVIELDGMRTNIVLPDPHGAAIIWDAAEPREERRYKLLTGARPSGCISAFWSADGIHWTAVQRGPVIGTNPDCPLGFFRAPDGRYVVYHRVWGHGRRVFRSESWDFVHWSAEPRLVFEPDAGDPTNTQFYGLGATPYGPYELGTLWIYHTDEGDPDIAKMGGIQQPELAYARSGYAWHRAAQGQPFICCGGEGAWDRGNLQPASAPLYMEDEIRFYYAGSVRRHWRGWVSEPSRGVEAGLGLATIGTDRFVSLDAGEEEGELLTAAFPLLSAEVVVNAAVAEGGSVRVGLLTASAEDVPGCGVEECVPLTGDATAHRVRWGCGAQDAPVGQWVRLLVRARQASLYSLSVAADGETPVYHRFQEGNPQRNQVGRAVVELSAPARIA